MITENIARDAAMLISEQMLYVVKDSIHLINDTQLESFQRASSLWFVIKEELCSTEVARNICLDIEATPDNEIVQAIFRHQLLKHLKQDDDFTWNIERILYVQDFRKPVETNKVLGQRGIVQESVPTGNQQNDALVMPPMHASNRNQVSENTQHSGD